MKTSLVILSILFASVAWGEQATIVDIQPYTDAGSWTPYGNVGVALRENVTVKLSDQTITGDFRGKWASHLIVGDTIEATVSGDKLVLTQNGKTQKGKIVRRSR